MTMTMSKKLRTEMLFLCHVGYSTNFEQVKAILLESDPEQYEILREIAVNILERVVKVADRGFVNKNKKILAALADGKLLRKGLAKFSKVISEIVRLALLHNNLCSKYTNPL